MIKRCTGNYVASLHRHIKHTRLVQDFVMETYILLVGMSIQKSMGSKVAKCWVEKCFVQLKKFNSSEATLR